VEHNCIEEAGRCSRWEVCCDLGGCVVCDQGGERAEIGAKEGEESDMVSSCVVSVQLMRGVSTLNILEWYVYGCMNRWLDVEDPGSENEMQ
jgi:hypothetical protein